MMMMNLKNKIKSYFFDRQIRNYYKTSYEKNALICYITKPFGYNNIITHTNVYEARIIVKAFSDLGYNIDIVNYDTKKEINYSKYDLLFGFGNVFENSFYSKKDILRIYYATGSHVYFQNHAEIARVLDVYRTERKLALPKRIVPYTWSLSTSLSTAIIVLGNDFTVNTYKPYSNMPIYKLNATFLENPNLQVIDRRISLAKNKILWFGSAGLIHKGLDLCLDVIAQDKNLELHICGPKEKDFFEIFYDRLNKSNVHFHGYVDINSNEFKSIAEACLFAILPTCSEGQSTALLTAMSSGLIPIATKETGINIDNLGVVIKQLTHKQVKECIYEAVSKDEDELLRLSDKCREYTWTNHTSELFRENFINILKDILNG